MRVERTGKQGPGSPPNSWEAELAPYARMARMGRTSRVTLADGRVAALKRAAPGAPVGREATTLRFLHARGAPVPAVIAIDDAPDPSWVATEWAGDVTLDDALQQAVETGPTGTPHGGASAALGTRLATSVAMVEAAFAPLTERGAPRGARETLESLFAPWATAAASALAWLHERGDPRPRLQESVARAIDVARSSPLSVGPLDYHAGNVIVPGGSPDRPLVIVDLSATGWDWPARRLAQYAFATGARTPPGTFRFALDQAGTTEGASLLATVHGGEPDHWDAAIRAHATILVATAATHLRHVELGTAHASRASSWRNVDDRRDALRAILSVVSEDLGS